MPLHTISVIATKPFVFEQNLSYIQKRYRWTKKYFVRSKNSQLSEKDL